MVLFVCATSMCSVYGVLCISHPTSPWITNFRVTTSIDLFTMVSHRGRWASTCYFPNLTYFNLAFLTVATEDLLMSPRFSPYEFLSQYTSSATRFSLSMEMSRLTRDGTAEPVSRDQILRHVRGQGNIIFSVQLTTSRIGNLTRLIHTLLYVMTIHT